MIKTVLNWLKTVIKDPIITYLGLPDLKKDLEQLTMLRNRSRSSIKSLNESNLIDLIDPEAVTTPKAIKRLRKSLKRRKPVLNVPDVDLAETEVSRNTEHDALCAEIDNMLTNHVDYDGSGCETGDYLPIYDGFQPIQKITSPKKRKEHDQI